MSSFASLGFQIFRLRHCDTDNNFASFLIEISFSPTPIHDGQTIMVFLLGTCPVPLHLLHLGFLIDICKATNPKIWGVNLLSVLCKSKFSF